MKKTLNITSRRPVYYTVTDLTYAQVDHWYGHSRQDLKLDLIYPEDKSGKKYPCIVWICGGAWLTNDKSAHLAYLSKLAMEGFVVASVQYRTSNQAQYPSCLEDIKAAIRYLKAHSDRYAIDKEHFGVAGESAGGYLSAMTALVDDEDFDTGAYLEESSKVQCACTWYPPADATRFPNPDAKTSASSPESLMFGFNVFENRKKAEDCSPVSYVTKNSVPFLIIHGTQDHTVPYSQSEILYNKLELHGCDVSMITLEGADHADIHFFQEEVWQQMLEFFKEKLN